MGLYLCIFNNDEELESVEIGFYSDFNFLRDTVVATVENSRFGTVCPVFVMHSDSDGEWSHEQSEQLLKELYIIEEKFTSLPPVDFNSEWKRAVAKECGISTKCLLDCFFDINGEPLIERLKGLAELSIKNRLPIYFQ